MIQPLKSDTVRLLAETFERIPQAGGAGLKKPPDLSEGFGRNKDRVLFLLH